MAVTHELLKKWRARHGNDDTGMVDELCRVLKEAGRTDLAETIKCGEFVTCIHAGVAVQNVEWSRTSNVSGSRLGIVVVVQRNGKNTCALETVVCNLWGRKQRAEIIYYVTQSPRGS